MTRAIRLFVLVSVMIAVPAASFGAVAVSITIGPPLLPVYTQPICPGAGYIWTPGYWAYGPYGYYWVPGTWVLAPFIGALWTPGYWGWGGGGYFWHAGYWGPHIGFYGGINYGFGYVGVGYEGGYWNRGSFYYNSSVNNVNRTVVRNVYSKTVIDNREANRVSYNGGRGGITARPTAAESAAVRDRHVGATSAQTRLERSASSNHAQLASVNHGRPAALATQKPEAFAAHQAAPANRAARDNVAATHRTGSSATRNNAAATHRTGGSTARDNVPATHRSTTAARAPRVASSAHPSHQASKPRAVSHTASRPAQHNTQNAARSTAAPRPTATTHNHAVAQHSTPHSTPAPRHSAAPASHYSARNTAPPAHHATPQPHSAPAEHSAQPHPSTPRSREGHGG
jgi:hypothetical protein